jgi:hypothetical protein
MTKQQTNSVSNPASPHSPQTQGSGSVVKYSDGGGKGGFRPNPDKTVLGTMNSIMSDKYNKK